MTPDDSDEVRDSPDRLARLRETCRVHVDQIQFPRLARAVEMTTTGFTHFISGGNPTPAERKQREHVRKRATAGLLIIRSALRDLPPETQNGAFDTFLGTLSAEYREANVLLPEWLQHALAISTPNTPDPEERAT